MLESKGVIKFLWYSGTVEDVEQGDLIQFPTFAAAVLVEKSLGENGQFKMIICTVNGERKGVEQVIVRDASSPVNVFRSPHDQ